MQDDRIVCWVSCGVASVCAAILCEEIYGETHEIRYVYNPIKEEHHDNIRYLKDVGDYMGVKIEIAKNLSYPDCSAEKVWMERKYMSGVHGAPCTDLLKKESRRQWEDLNSFDGYHVFGFTVDEKHRHDRRVADNLKVLPILIDRGMTKQDCFDMMKKTNISPPEVYSIGSRFGNGYPNANCIGCVKATSPTYWNHVRETFPEVFEARAKLSREIGCKLVRYKGKRIFLDELPPDAKGRSMKTMKIECGISCGKDD